MKNLFFVLTILTVFVACARNDISLTQMFGDNFFELEFQKGRCSFKKFQKTENKEYPFYIAYPQKGIQLFVTDQNEVGTVYYLAKC